MRAVNKYRMSNIVVLLINLQMGTLILFILAHGDEQINLNLVITFKRSVKINSIIIIYRRILYPQAIINVT